MEPQDPDHRTRHVAFRVEAREPVDRGDVVDAVRAVGASRLGEAGLEAMFPWVTLFDGTWGLLRVRHTHQAEAREVLGAIGWLGEPGNEADVEAVGTAGTIRAAREKHIPGSGPG
jgi:RNase P/RNase MRP subunit POP5